MPKPIKGLSVQGHQTFLLQDLGELASCWLKSDSWEMSLVPGFKYGSRPLLLVSGWLGESFRYPLLTFTDQFLLDQEPIFYCSSCLVTGIRATFSWAVQRNLS